MVVFRCVGGQWPPLRLNVCKSFATVRRGRRTLRYNIYHQIKLGGAVRNNEQTSCATRVCRACVEQPICVAVNYSTLRIG